MTTETFGGAFVRLRSTGFKGRAQRIDDIDLPRIGHRIGVGEDEIHAFMDVETTGSGFDDQGRPKILFEPHVFYRCLSPAKRGEAVKQGLACQKWGQIPYGKTSEQYPRLERALLIDEAAALKACSWGLGQVLGENHIAAGYDTVQNMVLAMADDEENHLDAMVNFLVYNSLDDDLREHRWEALARGYNGPGYAKNKYHLKLPQAYAKWAKIKNTPWSPASEPVIAPTPILPPPAIEPVPAAQAPPDIEPTSVPVSQPATSGGFFTALADLLKRIFA
jgi:hypothetical protein